MLKSHSISIMATVSLLCACDSAPPVKAASELDRSELEIIENTYAIWQPGQEWRIGVSPSIDIGVQEGESAYELHRPHYASRLSDGRIVVGNTGSHELRFYDQNGHHLTSAGDKGGGPGEFQRITWVGSANDSILVYDGNQRRLTVFNSEGEYVRATTLEDLDMGTTLARESRSSVPHVGGLMSDGSLLASLILQTAAADLPTGLTRDSVQLLKFAPDCSMQKKIGTFPNQIRDVQARQLGRIEVRGPTDIAFSPRTVWTTGGDIIYVATTDRYEIKAYDSEGTAFRIIRKQHQPEKVTETHRIQLLRNRRESKAGGPANAEVDFLLGAMEESPLPETLPAFDPDDRDDRGMRVGSSLIVDAVGNLWVQEYRLPGDRTPKWSVFNGGGQLLGEVVAPDGLIVTEVGADYVLGWWTDEVDVPHILLYSLNKQ